MADMQARLSRLFTGALVLAALAHVALLLPRFAELSGVLPARFQVVLWAVALTVVTAVGACVLAGVLVVRSWHRSGARSLALFLAFLAAVWGSLLRFLEVSLVPGTVSVNVAAGGWSLALASAGMILAAAAFLRVSVLFPGPLRGTDLRPARHLAFLRRVRVALFRPSVVWGTALVAVALTRIGASAAGWIEPEQRPQLALVLGLGPSVVLMLLAPLAAIGLGARNLVTGYRLATPGQRRPVLWLVVGLVTAGWLILVIPSVFAVLAATDVSIPDPLMAVMAALVLLAPTVLVVSTAVAVFYDGAVDPGLVLRRSTVYGALGAGGLLLFAGLENALSSWVEATLGLPGFTGSLLAGALAAAVMFPLRHVLARAATAVLPRPESAAGGAPEDPS